jgi:hypothetical protein
MIFTKAAERWAHSFDRHTLCFLPYFRLRCSVRVSMYNIPWLFYNFSWKHRVTLLIRSFWLGNKIDEIISLMDRIIQIIVT